MPPSPVAYTDSKLFDNLTGFPAIKTLRIKNAPYGAQIITFI
jgi:hypothetical protein